MSFPAGSGVLRFALVEAGGGTPGDGDPGSCLTTYYNEDDFDRTVQTTAGPFVSGSSPWGTNWRSTPDVQTGTLSFPGNDVPHPFPNNPTDRINQISQTFAAPDNLKLIFDSLSGGAGPTPVEAGYTGDSQNFDPIVIGTKELGNPTGNVWLGVWHGGPYNPSLTGSGTWEYTPPDHGTSGTKTSISGGIATVIVNNSYFNQQMVYKGNLGVNQDVVVGTFQTKFSSVSSANNFIKLTYGPASVTLTPSTSSGSVAVTTGSGSSSTGKTDWIAGQWYVTTVLLNLPDNEVTVRVYPEGSPDSAVLITLAANGERAFADDYQPTIAIRVETTDGADWTVQFRSITSNAYYSPATSESDFEGEVALTTDGWGSPWVVWADNDQAAPDPGLGWSASGGFGTVQVIDENNVDGNFIAKPLSNAGEIEVWFSVRDYPIFFTFLEVYFHRTGTANQKRDGVGIGTTVNTTIGTLTADSDFVNVPHIVDGSPINVRIVYSPPTISVWVWKEGTTMPTRPTCSSTLGNINSQTSALATELIIWPNIFDNGQKLVIGGVDAGLGSGYPFITSYTPPTNVAPIIEISVGATSPGGRVSSWPFADPGDGRAYGVAWGQDIYVEGDPIGVGTPSYSADVVWGQFGDLGPGAPRSIGQSLADLAFPPYLVNGVPAEFDVIITGEFGLSLNGWSSGTGEATFIAMMKTYSYDVDNHSAPPPPRSDYFIQNGHVEHMFQFLLREGGNVSYQPFRIRCDASGSGGGINIDAAGDIHFLWSVEVLDAHATIRSAGPFDQNGFLTAHVGALFSHFRNVKYEIAPRLVPVIGLAEPCEPIGAGTSGTGGAVVVPPQLVGSGNPRE